MRVFHKRSEKIGIGRNYSRPGKFIPRNLCNSTGSRLEPSSVNTKKKGKWDTFFPRTLKNSMHPWVYSSSRYAGRGKLDKIIPPLQIKEQSSWNSWLRKEREISHISYFPLPSFAFMRLVHVAIHLHDASKIDENAGNISERRFQAGGDIKPVYVGAFWKWLV